MTAEKLTLSTLTREEKRRLSDWVFDSRDEPWMKLDRLVQLKLVDNHISTFGPTSLGVWVVDNKFFSWVTDEHVDLLRNPNDDHAQEIFLDLLEKDFIACDEVKYDVWNTRLTHKGLLLLALLTGDFGDLNLDPEVKCQSQK